MDLWFKPKSDWPPNPSSSPSNPWEQEMRYLPPSMLHAGASPFCELFHMNSLPHGWDQEIGVACPRSELNRNDWPARRNNPLRIWRWGTDHFSLLLKRSTWRQQDPEWDLLVISESSTCSLGAKLRLIPTLSLPLSPPLVLNTSWHQAYVIEHWLAQGPSSWAQEGGILLAQTSSHPSAALPWVRMPLEFQDPKKHCKYAKGDLQSGQQAPKG